MTQKRTITLLAVSAIVVCLALAAWAQGGPGKACGAGGCKVSQACPMTGQQKCCMQGGWWTSAKPQTPVQKAFVADITQRYEQIKAKQLELAALQAADSPREQLAAVQNEIRSMCAGMCNLMKQNQALGKQMGAPDCANCACATGKCNGCVMGAVQDGWWNRVQPKTDAEKAFVADVKGFHGQIVASQAAGDIVRANSLRATLRDLMYKNQALHRQVMMSVGCAPATCGQGNRRGAGCGMGNGQGKGRGCCPLSK